MITREKVIKEYQNVIYTGYLSDKKGKFIYHSFDDEPALIYKDGTKFWYKDGKLHRDNQNPAVIYPVGVYPDSVYPDDSYYEFFKNDERYWFINDTEYRYNELKEKFKNNIIKLYNVANVNILNDNGIDVIYILGIEYIILDQDQYNLAVLKYY